MLPALVGISAFLAATVQATTGLGFALILTPILFACLSSSAGAIVLATGLGLELNLLILLAERRRPRVVWHEVVPMVLAAVPGTVCGLLLLRALAKPVLQIGVGVLVVAAALARVRVARRSVRPARSDTRVALGFATGAMATSTGVTGPPVALWFSRRGMTPPEIRDSLSSLFVALGLIALVALVPVLPRAHLNVAQVAAGLACVLIGHRVGSRAFARVESDRFEPLLLGVILCAGLGSVLAGVISL